MRRTILLSLCLLTYGLQTQETQLNALDSYWKNMSQTVTDGNFDGYAAAYHPDAVVVFATATPKRSVSIAEAMTDWKQGFDDTKNKQQTSQVNFRFSERIIGTNTAHETGIFHYTARHKDGRELANVYVHFEMLLVYKNGKWLGLMELQRSLTDEKAWKELKEL